MRIIRGRDVTMWFNYVEDDGTVCASVLGPEATTPWRWSRLAGLWASWDHGDDWVVFDATGGRQVVRRSVEQGGRPWFTSERRPEQ